PPPPPRFPGGGPRPPPSPRLPRPPPAGGGGDGVRRGGAGGGAPDGGASWGASPGGAGSAPPAARPGRAPPPPRPAAGARRAGAGVVVNDLGATISGEGSDATPAQAVVAEIEELGSEAVADGENVADFAGAKRLVERAVVTFGRLDILVNNAGILRDRMLVNM